MQSQTVIRKNIFAFWLSYGIYYMASGILSESYIQAYLMELGLDTRAVGLYGTAGMLAALIGYASFSRLRISGKGYLKVMFVFGLLMCAFPPALIAAGTAAAPVVLLCAGIAVYQLSAAVRFSCEYCAVPMLFPRKEYGSLSAKCGILGAALAAAISLISAAVPGEAARSRYAVFFLIAFAALVISALAVRIYRLEPSLVQEESSSEAVKMTLRRKCWLLLPHFLRGAALSCYYYFVSVAFENVSLSGAGQSLFVTAGVVCMMGGCYAFILLQKKFRTGTIILVSNLLSAAAALSVCSVRTEAGFFAAYMIYTCCVNITAYAIPAGVIYATSAGELPFVSSMRMFAMNGATCVLLTPVARLLTVAPAWTVMAAGGVIYALCGLIFFRQYRDDLAR